MLDYNRRPGVGERINAAVDEALEAERAATPRRDDLPRDFSSTWS